MRDGALRTFCIEQALGGYRISAVSSVKVTSDKVIHFQNKTHSM